MLVWNESNGSESVIEVGLPEGNHIELRSCVLEEFLQAMDIRCLECNNVLAVFMPVLKLRGSRKSKSSDSMCSLSYLIARSEIAACNEVERVCWYLGVFHDVSFVLFG